MDLNELENRLKENDQQAQKSEVVHNTHDESKEIANIDAMDDVDDLDAQIHINHDNLDNELQDASVIKDIIHKFISFLKKYKPRVAKTHGFTQSSH